MTQSRSQSLPHTFVLKLMFSNAGNIQRCKIDWRLEELIYAWWSRWRWWFLTKIRLSLSKHGDWLLGWLGGGQGAGASGEDLGAETGQTIWAGFPPEVSFLPWFACNHSVQCTLYNVHIFPGFHISFLQRATDMRRPPISRTRLTSAPSSAKLDPSMNQIALGDLRLWTSVSDH